MIGLLTAAVFYYKYQAENLRKCDLSKSNALFNFWFSTASEQDTFSKIGGKYLSKWLHFSYGFERLVRI